MSRYLGISPFDGPSDTRSRSGSQHSAGSQARSEGGRSRAGSASAAASGPKGYPKPLGFDPGREGKPMLPEEERSFQVGRRVDLPPEAFVKPNSDHPFQKRPGLGNAGKKIGVRTNQFRVVGVPNFDIHQYDVAVTPQVTKKSFGNTIWKTKPVQDFLKKAGPHAWIYDGSKIAWSRNMVAETSVKINMDDEKGRPTRPGREPDIFYLTIRKTTTVRLDILRAYLTGQGPWDTRVLECMNFLDHLLREWPRQNLVAHKRNFYDRDEKRKEVLTSGSRHVIALKGIYASIRTNSSIRSGGMGLGINVDVANTTFWNCNRLSFADLVYDFIKTSKREWEQLQPIQICRGLEPQHDAYGKISMPEMWKHLRRLSKLNFVVNHRGKGLDPKPYKVKNFLWDIEKHPKGTYARNYTFEYEGKTVTIEQYFRLRYNIFLKHPNLPLIETTRNGIFPMEVCYIDPFQKYNFKLDGEQTAKMIKFAVTRPPQRSSDIMNSIKMLKWREDPFLKEFGLQIKDQMEVVQARVLANPIIQFAKKTIDPKTSGRWDLRDQVFAMPNIRPLHAWAVIIVNECVNEVTAKHFVNTFVKTFKGHGGVVTTPMPPFKSLRLEHTGRTGDQMAQFYMEVGQHFKQSPDMLFYIMRGKDLTAYERIKKSMDVRVATLSQIVLAPHVVKSSPQYCSNVATKVNAKLGGYTSKLKDAKFFKAPTMMIGCDVSHGQAVQPGIDQLSLAAITMSMDVDAVTYNAACETNGHHKEILSHELIWRVFPPMVKRWCKKMRTAPQHIFYFRDGVSEGEFHAVLDEELLELRKVFIEVAGVDPNFTVIVGTKRHHLRFFPANKTDGDKNGNPLPGTVVEHEVTHPFHYDFYLNSHVAIQGTARPVHYQILKDEIGMPVDVLQNMIYSQCYQYVRSTTPVSLHPAIYYAHLAAARARAHEDIKASDKDPITKMLVRTSGAIQMRAAKERAQRIEEEGEDVEFKERGIPWLLEIGFDDRLSKSDNIKFFKSTMWFI